MNQQQHWQNIYRDRDSTSVSWFRPHLESSIEEIDAAVYAQSLTPETAKILDAGGGASHLVDDLLARGYRRIVVADIAQSALDIARCRLADRAEGVEWICADLTADTSLPTGMHVWHDRAVFHFLTTLETRAQYIDAVRRTLVDGGHLIVSTFGPEGPQRCSDLPTMRYDSSSLAAAVGDGFVLLRDRIEMHRTPAGIEQQFLLACFRLAL